MRGRAIADSAARTTSAPVGGDRRLRGENNLCAGVRTIAGCAARTTSAPTPWTPPLCKEGGLADEIPGTRGPSIVIMSVGIVRGRGTCNETIRQAAGLSPLSGSVRDGQLLRPVRWRAPARFLSRDGEPAELAFAVLVERHASAVLRLCRAIAGNESDAEDAFQATFLVLATRGDRLIVRETLGPWLACVARRISRRARAAARARLARETRAARRAGSRETAPADANGDDLDSVLHEEIDRLPERYRLPIVLCDLDSQSHQEVARRLGWPVGTVKSRQARARQRPARSTDATRGLRSTAGGRFQNSSRPGS